MIFREDIGRHNAIDMIGGQCFLDNISTRDKLIVTTGRIASEILLKAIRLGVPILASGAAATRFSIDLARKTNMTLIGKVEQARLIVYNSGGRIAGL
jgi:FdhD protein